MPTFLARAEGQARGRLGIGLLLLLLAIVLAMKTRHWQPDVLCQAAGRPNQDGLGLAS